MPISKTARFKVKPESIEKCKGIIQECVALVKQNEPGTLFYFVVQGKEDPTIFLFFRISEDEAAQDQHNNAPYLKHYVDLFDAESTEPAIGTDWLTFAIRFDARYGGIKHDHQDCYRHIWR